MTRNWADLSRSERNHLIWTMLAEARGEGESGMAAVAWVIRNRSNHPDWDSSLVEIVTNRVRGSYEFSPWGDGSLIRYADGHPSYERAEAIARQVFNADRSTDPTRGATFFEATSITDTWMENNSRGELDEDGIQQSRLIRGVVVGNHQFYNLSSYYYSEIQHRSNGVLLRDGTRDMGVIRENGVGAHFTQPEQESLRRLAAMITCHDEPSSDRLHFANRTYQAGSIQSMLERAGIATDAGGADNRVDGVFGNRTIRALQTIGLAIGIENAVTVDRRGNISINEDLYEVLQNAQFISTLRTAVTTDVISAPASPFGASAIQSLFNRP